MSGELVEGARDGRSPVEPSGVVHAEALGEPDDLVRLLHVLHDEERARAELRVGPGFQVALVVIDGRLVARELRAARERLRDLNGPLGPEVAGDVRPERAVRAGPEEVVLHASTFPAASHSLTPSASSEPQPSAMN